jgi:hypothetical protein
MTPDKEFETLKEEFHYYLDHQGDFVQKYDGKVIVLKNHEVLGTYDTELDAIVETRKEHEPGTFMVQKVSEGEEDYTVTIHSPVFPP